MQTVTIPGYGDVDFPDTMTPDEVNQAAHKVYLQYGMANDPNRPAISKPNLTMEESNLAIGANAAMRPASRGTQAELENTPSPVVGAAKGYAQTVYPIVRVGANLASKVLGDGSQVLPTQRPEALSPKGLGENIGYGAEAVGEFVLGDEALKSLPLLQRAEKALEAQKAAQVAASKSSVIARALEIGMTFLRQGTVGGVQAAAHGEDAGDALTTGLITGGLGAAGEIVGEGLASLKPGKLVVNGTTIPVRASVEKPSLFNKAAEFIADKPALQKFDIEQTQTSARAALQALAESSKDKTMTQLAVDHMSTFFDDTGNLKPGRTTDDIQKLVAEYMEYAQTPTDNFRDFSSMLKARLSSYYQAADSVAVKAGEPTFKIAQDAEKQALAAFDSTKVASAIDQQRAIFDQANGQGMYDKVRSMYTRVDALGKIGEKLDALAVVKPTPVGFLKPGAIDPGVIDGAALRRAVAELSRDKEFAYKAGKLVPVSVFERAGIDSKVVQSLQNLGAILEKSKVEKISSGWRGPMGAGAAGGATAEGISMLITHVLSGGTAVAGISGGYLANKFLGMLMTEPKAAEYTLRAIKTMVPATANAVQLTNTAK